MKQYTTLITILLTGATLFAQITLKQHNFVSIGDTIVEHYKNFPSQPIDVGTPGPNKIWDFSNLNAVANDTLMFVNPKNTPFANEFPEATIALYTKRIYEVWMYMKNTNVEFGGLGSGVFAQGEKRIDKRKETIIRYPLNYGDNVTNSFKRHAIIAKNIKGQDSIKRTRLFEHETVVDSWGDIILPTGKFLSLRLKHIISTTEFFYKKQGNTWKLDKQSKKNTSIYYQWWTDDKNTKHPVAQIVMDKNHEKPIVVKFLSAVPFAEVMSATVETGLKLYPNPAKAYINVDVDNTFTKAYISIYSFGGKLVQNLKMSKPKTNVNLQNIANGTYFVIIRSQAGKIIGKSKFIKY